MNINSPLDGVRVIDFGQFIAAPAATQILVDLGADVIKVEPVHGESARGIGPAGEAMLQNYNRGKRSIALDLKDPQAQEIARKLIAGADIVVQNLRPGVMESFGLGADQILAAHPRIVYATVSGFGLHGPSKYRPGLDIAAQAESGMMWVTGEADREPQKVGAQIVDVASGYVCAQAILAAYVRRLRTGEGDTVEVSLLEVALHLQGTNWGQYLITGEEPIRKGNGQPSIAPAADVMTTKDGNLVLSAYSDVHFHRLCRLIGRLDLAEDPRFASNTLRVANRQAMLIELRSAFSTMTSDEAMELLTTNGVVAGRINTYPEAMRSADVEASGLFIEVSDTDGASHTALGSPWHLGSIPKPGSEGDPDLGQHTAELLTELGYPAAAVDALVASDIVRLR
ncbi:MULTISPECIES: CaiB/BaiF CoA transferase family protein [unclassified Rhodococcus (in: high G+C Gram-positive bacteria)]|uniref:CaiB/BaiF CoA transferase family protein n=1 Tax=unclassified Rhodococcus (in: high G+C Gram-positive bacteria) TaxID=192944 RepID=UPI00200A365F|nr:CoA transferase [Rhodococcus sp. HM1]MCK8671467.1 CoA transferase [Rhodococcus sp. HM1]